MSTALWGMLIGIPVGWIARLVYVGYCADRPVNKTKMR